MTDKQAVTELLPCPFCGGDQFVIEAVSNTGGNVKYVWCTECHASGSWSRSHEKDKAIAAWNARAAQPKGVEMWAVKDKTHVITIAFADIDDAVGDCKIKNEILDDDSYVVPVLVKEKT